jgi:hypothetical protein
MVLRLAILTNSGTWRGPVDELIRIGPLRVRVRLSAEVRGNSLGSPRS